MGPYGYALTQRDELRLTVMAGAGWHLDLLAKTGGWSARCDVTHGVLGRYGLHRN
jgi:hypothetical protein